jgi:type I restriction enzyme M protein
MTATHPNAHLLEDQLWSVVELLQEAANEERDAYLADPSDARAITVVLPTLLVLLLLRRNHDQLLLPDASRGSALHADAQLALFGAASARKPLAEQGAAIGRQLEAAWTTLEQARPVLRSASSRLAWHMKPPLWSRPSSAFRHALDRLAKLNLDDGHQSDSVQLGLAVDAVIDRMLTEAGKVGRTAGEYCTTRAIVDLVVELADPSGGMRLCDPTCGLGGFLVACARRARRRNAEQPEIQLFGQEINGWFAAIAQLRLALDGHDHARIEVGDTLVEPRLLERGDTLVEPRLLERDRLMQFDLVVGDPPFGLSWKPEEAKRDRFERFARGVPARNRADVAFLLHMIATLGPGGRAIVVTAPGVLFRGGSEKQARESLVRDDLITAIIALPPNLYSTTAIPTTILVIERAKRKERQGRILFVDASRDYVTRGRRFDLAPEHVHKIASAVRRFEDVPGYARVVPCDELDDYNLTVGRYVEKIDTKPIDLEELSHRVREHERVRDEAAAEMDRLIEALAQH